MARLFAELLIHYLEALFRSPLTKTYLSPLKPESNQSARLAAIDSTELNGGKSNAILASPGRNAFASSA